jgi:outer membrane protein assembly factor BamB
LYGTHCKEAEMLVLILLAQTPQVLWSNVTSGGVYCTVDMGDINGDDISDVVCGVNFWDEEPTLWALSGSDGSAVWTSDAHNGIYSDEGMVRFPDVNGDGIHELLMATPGGYNPPGRTLRLVSGADGSLVWEWAACQVMPAYTGWGYSCAELPDVNGDGVSEAVGGFGTSGSSGSGLAVCVDGATGDSIWTRWQPDAVSSLALLADVDGDELEDVLAAVGGNGYTTLTAMLLSGATGETLWQNSPGGDCMSVAAVDRTDTFPWAVFCTFNGLVVCYDAGGSFQWSYTGSGMFLEVTGGPDLNGDGISEVALAADDGGVVCLSGSDGSVIWSYPSGANTWSVAWVDPVLIQGDEVPCVAAGAVNGRAVTLVNALTGQPVWQMAFDERVYNVSTAGLSYPSPVVVAGLQDQQSTPEHAWALASSTELQVSGAGPAVPPRWLNPSSGLLVLALPHQSAVEAMVFDLTGRIVLSGNVPPGNRTMAGELRPGCYLVRTETADGIHLEKVTVIR